MYVWQRHVKVMTLRATWTTCLKMTVEPISNDLINLQEEVRLLDALNETIDEFRNGRVTRVQVIGVLYLLQQEIIAEVLEPTTGDDG